LYRNNKNYRNILCLIIVCGIIARLIFAPFSGHGDLEAFWFSAQHFLFAKFDFYYFIHTRAGMWAYPPLWLWLVTGAYLVSFSTTAYEPSFLLLVKTPMIVADVTVAYVLYSLLGGDKGRFAAAFWLANPMSIFITSIFGQFDPLVPALIIISVLGLERGMVVPSAVIYGSAIMTKQYAIFIAPLLIARVLRDRGKGDALKFTSLMTITALLISLPFLISGSRQVYIREIWMTRSTVEYDDLYCQFAGFFQFLSWLHERFKIDTLPFFHLSYPILFLTIGFSTGLAFFCKRMNYMTCCLISTAAFLTLSWYINPQYTVVFIPFMIYDVLAHNTSKLWLIATILPFLWPLSSNGFAPYFRGTFSLPYLGAWGVAISALIFFITLFTYMLILISKCLKIEV
jgi:Gpi18-like mannosyltransferase